MKSALKKLLAWGLGRSTWLWWAALVLLSAVIYWQSCGPVTIGGPEIIGRDKILHAGAFGLWCTFALLALRTGFRRWPELRVTTSAGLLTAVYGASDEFHQSFVAERTADVGDLVADAVGAVLAIIVWYWLRGRGAGALGRPGEGPR